MFFSSHGQVAKSDVVSRHASRPCFRLSGGVVRNCICVEIVGTAIDMSGKGREAGDDLRVSDCLIS